MNKLILALSALVVMVTGASAQSALGIRPYGWHDRNQVTAQSVAVTTSPNSLSVLYLADGASDSYTAIAYPVFEVIGLKNRVNIVALGAYQLGTTKTNLYAGAGVSVNVFSSNGWNADLIFGLKGLDATNFTFTPEGKNPWVVGFGISVPFKGL